MTSYMRDLSICSFWYREGGCPGPSPLRIQRDKCGDNPDTQNVSFARKTKNTTWPFVVNTVDPWPISLLTHLPFKLTPCLL